MKYDELLKMDIVDKNALRFEEPSFDNSIIGIDYYGRLIYDYNSMVKELMQTYDITKEEATDFIYHNTFQSLNYQFDSVKPIIIMHMI